VRDNGATSCVAAGDAGPGSSCLEAHCATGLVCLGANAPGANMAHSCFKLCHTDGGAECASGEVCATALPLFPNPAFGVCETSDAGY
jgi:hypothetical protein